MKVYISGPMTGIENYNHPDFAAAARSLRERGHEPVSPACTPVAGWAWEDYMRQALRLLLDCEAIHLLPGWETSRGANIEASLARHLKMCFNAELETA